MGTVKVEDARQQLVLDKEELKKKARRSARRVYKLHISAPPHREINLCLIGGTAAVMPGALFTAESLYIGMEVVIALASVVGNVMVVWAVKINKSLRDTTFCFIVSLALADIAVGALVIPLAITISIGLQTHFYSCLLVACTVLVLTQSSILALLAIAIDRYLRVKIPTR